MAQPRIYQIPTNFQESGYMFNGMIAKRNALDALVLGAFGFLLATLLPLEGEMAISGYILCIGFFGMFGILGFKGLPISTYLIDLISWSKRRKPYLYNYHGDAFSISAADLMLSEPQLRDALADALDHMKETMANRQPEYIEGETFEFVADPELEALKAAEERRLEEQAAAQTAEAEQKPEKEEPKKEEPKKAEPAAAPVGSLDIDEIVGNIVLHDIEEGGNTHGGK